MTIMQMNRGTKRHCAQCGANYYDLNRSPITCPKCHADYVAVVRPPSRGPVRGARAVVPVPVEEEPQVADAFAEDEVLSEDVDEEDLEEAEAQEEDDSPDEEAEAFRE